MNNKEKKKKKKTKKKNNNKIKNRDLEDVQIARTGNIIVNMPSKSTLRFSDFVGKKRKEKKKH